MLKNSYLVLLFLSIASGLYTLDATQRVPSGITKKASTASISQKAEGQGVRKKRVPRTRKSRNHRKARRLLKRVHGLRHSLAKKMKQSSDYAKTEVCTAEQKRSSSDSHKKVHPLLKTALFVAAKKIAIKKRAQRMNAQRANAQRVITRRVNTQRAKEASLQPVDHSIHSASTATTKREQSARRKSSHTASLRTLKTTQEKVVVTKQSSSDALKPAKAQAEWEKVQQEALFIWPIKLSEFWISSFFGPRKKPNGSWGFHSGLDLAACRGTPVHATGTGVVTEAAFMSGYGKCIVIVHNEEYKTRYAHLDKIVVKRGQKVLCGDLIGKVGATGTVRKSSKNGSGSHLHFELYQHNKRVNPLYFLA